MAPRPNDRSRARRPGSPRKSGPGNRWAFLCAAGWEDDLAEELGPGASRAGEAVVTVPERPRGRDGEVLAPTFARQAMRVERAVPPRLAAVARALADALGSVRSAARITRWTLHVVAPDGSDPHDPRRAVARELDDGIAEALDALLDRDVAEAFVDDELEAERFAQIWVVDDETAFVGLTAARDVLSRRPGARRPAQRGADLPSRAGLKLEEAFEWIGVSPGRGETVVDLGAAPGAWSLVAARTGARVTAVDRKPLELPEPHPRIEAQIANAFEFAPEDTVDWLLVDLSARPHDVSQLLAKWGRKVWARQVVASVKLPMRLKVEEVERLRETLEAAHWQGLRIRQLFLDRAEVTLYAHLDPRYVIRGYQPTFSAMRAARDGEADARDGGPAPGARRRSRDDGARGSERSGGRPGGRSGGRAGGRSGGRSAGRAAGRVRGGGGRAGPRSGGRTGGRSAPRSGGRSGGSRRSGGPRSGGRGR